jgi:hypothetical protein
MTNFNSTDLNNLTNSREKTMNSGPYRSWQDYSVVLTNMSSSTVLTFGGWDINLDDVMLTPIPSDLDQNSDNSAYIKGNAGQVRDVQLQRILTPNVWCPLCLPFDVTPESMATALVTSCELNTLASVSDGIFTFNTVSDATISAGTPFLVKTTAQVENPTFSGVTIKNVEAQEDGNETYKFVGTYSPVYLETNGSELFLGTDGDLYKPGTGEGYNRLGGLRAYFRVPTGAKARVMFNDVDGIETLSMPQIEVGDKKTYDLQGRPVVKGQTQRKHLIIEKGRKRLVTD